MLSACIQSVGMTYMAYIIIFLSFNQLKESGPKIFQESFRETAKLFFLVGRPLRGEGEIFEKMWLLSSRGGGGYGLSGRATKKWFFCGFPYGSDQHIGIRNERKHCSAVKITKSWSSSSSSYPECRSRSSSNLTKIIFHYSLNKDLYVCLLYLLAEMSMKSWL